LPPEKVSERPETHAREELAMYCRGRMAQGIAERKGLSEVLAQQALYSSHALAPMQ
jgi:hypothetical protein